MEESDKNGGDCTNGRGDRNSLARLPSIPTFCSAYMQRQRGEDSCLIKQSPMQNHPSSSPKLSEFSEDELLCNWLHLVPGKERELSIVLAQFGRVDSGNLIFLFLQVCACSVMSDSLCPHKS